MSLPLERFLGHPSIHLSLHPVFSNHLNNIFSCQAAELPYNRLNTKDVSSNAIQTWISGDIHLFTSLLCFKTGKIQRANFIINHQIIAELSGKGFGKFLIQPPVWSRNSANSWSEQPWLLVGFIPALHTVLFSCIFLTWLVFTLFHFQEPLTDWHCCVKRCTDT